MDDGFDGGEPGGADPGARRTAPGWYPDPWVAESRRYWNGTEWTPLTFPDRTVGDSAGAAARAGAANPFATRTTPPAAAAPPPHWVGPDRSVTAEEPVHWEVLATPEPTRRRAWPIALSVGAVLVAVALIAAFVATSGGGSSPAAAPPTSSAPAGPPTSSPPLSPGPGSPTAPAPQPTGPGAVAPPVGPGGAAAQRALARLGLRQSDVDPAVLVLPIPGGTEVTGQATLDLCNATYPSESQRRARVQVAGYEIDGSTRLSTEAVQYASTGAVAQAWAEIHQAASRCSTTEPGATLRADVDHDWPSVRGVQRLAYDLTATDASGAPTHSVVVYLSRGNVLLGVYFPAPDGPQLQVDGRSTIPGIVDVFARRLAALPPAGLAGVGGGSGGGSGGGPGGGGPTA